MGGLIPLVSSQPLPWFRPHCILLESCNPLHTGLHTNLLSLLTLRITRKNILKHKLNLHDPVPTNLYSFILQHLLSYSSLYTSPIQGLPLSTFAYVVPFAWNALFPPILFLPFPGDCPLIFNSGVASSRSLFCSSD